MSFSAKKFDELGTGELYEILKSRAEIFQIEQKIHYLDLDNVDYDSLHCFIMEENRVTAYLRAFYPDTDPDTVKIGRVLTLRHGNGTGRKLMEQSIRAIRENMKCRKISMDAQKHAAGFYEKLGFQVVSGDFLEAGIVHVGMEMEIASWV